MLTGLKKVQHLPWVLAFAGAFGIHAWSLMRYPLPFVDEVWVTSRAWAFIQTGHQLGPLDTGAEIYPHAWVLNQWLFTFLQSLVLRFSAIPSLIPVRMMALGFGCILIFAAYQGGRQLIGSKAAALACLLLTFSTAFFYSAHSARYDIVAAALGYSALAVYLSPRGNRFVNGFFAAILVSLAVETHLNSIVFVLALFALIIFDTRSRFFRSPQTWGIAAGGLLGVVFFAAVHILPDPQIYFSLTRIQIQTGYAPPLTDPALWLDGLISTGRLVFAACTTSIIFVLISLPFLLRRKTNGTIRLLLINFVLLAGFILIIRNKTGFYAIFLAPGLFWMAGAYLEEFLQEKWQGRLRDYLLRVLVGSSILGMAALSLTPLTQNTYALYQSAQPKVNQVVEPGDKIMGSQIWWLGLPDHKYFSWEILFMYSRYHPGASMNDVFEVYKPDLFIFDHHLQGFISDDPSNPEYRLSRQAVIDFLTRHGRKIAEFDAYGFGPIEIYRLNWEK